VTGPVPLTPIQARFFEGEPAHPHHVNQAVLLAMPEAPDLAVLEAVLLDLLTHHDALRLRFRREGEGWQQWGAEPPERFAVEVVELGDLEGDDRTAALEREATRIQGSLDLEAELVRAAYFPPAAGNGDGGGDGGRLLLVIHHLAVDGVSWRVLVEDLETAYRQRIAGGELELQPKTTAYRQWAERLVEFARSPELDGEIAVWTAAEGAAVGPVPVDLPNPPEANTIASTRHLTLRLEKGETEALLRKVPEAFRTHINDALLTALVQSFQGWTGSRKLLVDLEGHGRDHSFEEIDVTRTVGWFTTLYPVLLDLGRHHQPGECLKAVKEQLRAVPRGGLSYGLLRYLRGDEALVARLAAMPAAAVSFNYLGQLDAVIPQDAFFRRSPEPVGATRSPEGQRRYLLEINGAVTEGRLELQWSYSGQMHRESTVERLLEGYRRAVRALIEAAEAPQEAAYTPSDFNKVKLDQSQLNNILQKVGAGGKKR
jgi:non-ribosomal peptide synthase protein (TIGR01720 family)